MTVSNQVNRVSYVGDGIEDEFPFTFKAFVTGDIKVYLDDVLQSSGYSVVLSTPPTDGGTVTITVPPVTGVDVTLVRELDYTQEADYPASGKFPSDTHETQLDRQVMMDQQLAETVGRAITAPLSSALTSFIITEIVANYHLAINATADGIITVDTSADEAKLAGIEALADVTDTANVTSSGALMDSEVDADLKTLALPANTTISVYMATVLDDASASDARTTLDVDQAGTVNPPEGTAVLSTGEATGVKFLREDGDGTCSWATLSGGGDALVANPLSQFANTTSLQLLGVISDETGTGSLVFSTSPTLVTPALGTPSALVLTNATGLPVTGLANGTDGELITWSAAGVPETVAVGTAAQVLTSNGVGAAPTFQAAGGGGGLDIYDIQLMGGI
jgi:hypothetical protein